MNVQVRVVACVALAIVCSSVSFPSKSAEIYLGAGVHRGDARVAFDGPSLIGRVAFKKSSTSWNAVLGVRPISLLGAEVEYVDFGSVSSGPQMTGSQNVGQIRGRLSATSIFGLLYFPLPVPALDIYAKAGYARINGKATTYPTGTVACPAIVPAPWYCFASRSHDLDENAIAAGAGAKLGLGSWALRAEYEAFLLEGPNTGIVSLSIVKNLF